MLGERKMGILFCPSIRIKKIFKDVQSAMGIKLMSLTMKLWEREIERILRLESNKTKNQFGFVRGRSKHKSYIHI